MFVVLFFPKMRIYNASLFMVTENHFLLLQPKRAGYESQLCASCSNKCCLRSTPQRYPPIFPSSLTTRWQGTTIATGFVAQARATARLACGCPMACAIWLYERVSP